MAKKKKQKATSICYGCDEEFEGTRQYCTPVCRKTLECKAKGTTKFLNNVIAPLFQRMIRAEDGARPSGMTPVIRDGVLTEVYRRKGQCACVTCGKVAAWSSGIGGIHTGHFISSRRASVLLLEENVAPQCSNCNVYSSGAPTEFRQWMESIRGGVDTIERLQWLKTVSVSYRRDQLVYLWFEYSARLNDAKATMKELER